MVHVLNVFTTYFNIATEVDISLPEGLLYTNVK
jgi:hypothetical protein